MRTILIALICTLGLTGLAAAQNQSVYTSTKTAACKTIKQSSSGAGYYVGACKGVGGYKLQLLEDDIRQSLNVITSAGKKQELDFWGLFTSFSAIGEKVEWRTKGRVPVALIARYSVADPEGVKKDISYLLVSKIGKTQSCVTDVVNPGPNQNVEARVLADKASAKACKKPE